MVPPEVVADDNLAALTAVNSSWTRRSLPESEKQVREPFIVFKARGRGAVAHGAIPAPAWP